MLVFQDGGMRAALLLGRVLFRPDSITKGGTTMTDHLNECLYEDCIAGMKRLPDKSFDLCLTDPPYNINPKQHKLSCGTNRYKQGAVFYDDNKNTEDWKSFCHGWFVEARRVSNILIFTPGEINLKLYCDIEWPRGMLIHHKPDSQGGNTVSWFLKHEHVFVYSDMSLQKHGMPPISVYKCNVGYRAGKLSHWCPKSLKLWMWLINGFKPKSVLDPFLGSGTTAEACELLGIPWLGFEIETKYRVDIEKRIARGKRKHQQGRLF